jgi:hypothetical protein
LKHVQKAHGIIYEDTASSWWAREAAERVPNLTLSGLSTRENSSENSKSRVCSHLAKFDFQLLNHTSRSPSPSPLHYLHPRQRKCRRHLLYLTLMYSSFNGRPPWASPASPSLVIQNDYETHCLVNCLPTQHRIAS